MSRAVPLPPLTRARWLRLAAGGLIGAALARPGAGRAAAPTAQPNETPTTPAPGPLQRRQIPASGERLPVIGCGTWIGFDHAPGSEGYARLPGVLDALFAGGGSVIDSSPMYGRAEETTGELLAAAGSRDRAFLATKVWTTGREEGIRQMEQSMRRLRAERIDLMQVHNLVDWRTQLATLREWKAAGRIRYLGVTHYTAGAYDQLAAVLQAERLDFVQLNYAIDDRAAEERLLPLARERGIAVIVNQPFGGGGSLRRLREHPLPGWAAEIGATSWAQVLLKFVLSHPAVTCAIPGTSRPEHMRDNLAAGRGEVPDRAWWTPRLRDVGV